MKREAGLLEAIEAEARQAPAIRRTPGYFPSARGEIFGWYHESSGAQGAAVAVICPPIGSEYTRSHRSLRHLADRLALAGVPALRFDYHGAGDSPGTDLDPDRLGAWRADIAAAIAHARRLSGCARVHLVGVRLGATLAALASAEADIDRLVLWNPCVQGRAYARELRALAAAAERQSCDIPGALESAGFVISAETLAAIGAIDLRHAEPRVRDRVLLVGRDDAATDAALAERLTALGIAWDERRLPGWAGMMAEHQFTVVPEAALDAIVAWLAAEIERSPRAGPSALPRERTELSFRPLEGGDARLEETLCRFGEDRHLFGVLTRRDASVEHPAVVVFNAGAAHHVGPNRLHVELTRNLAALGLPCLRFDLESLGDSVNRRPARENYPYPHGAVADGRAAIEFLRERFGYRRFIVLGLCSGAHTVFHAGLELADLPIEEIVMVNPMQFYWVEGMSLDTSRKFEDMVQYKRSMRDPRRWLKLARGDVNFRRMAEVVASQACTYARAWLDAITEAAIPSRGPRLSRDLRKLFAMGRRLSLFVSEGDPGRDILLAGAKLTASRALRDGRIRLQMIPDADHTFSQWKARRDFLGRVTAHLRNAAPSYTRTGPV
ncbi:MAG TPA: alpha/beta hydrolase [Usitatibacter sp.]|nr:alpha/beta hydrolase [Usitatibacter sp.]